MQMAGLLDIYHISTFPFLSINAVMRQDELALQGSKGRRCNRHQTGNSRGVYSLGFSK